MEAAVTRRELAETRNAADHAISSTERMIRENAGRLGARDQEALATAIENLKKVKDGPDAGETRRAIEAVHRASHEFSKALHEKEARPGAEPQTRNATSGVTGVENPDGEPGGEKGIDADFTTRS